MAKTRTAAGMPHLFQLAPNALSFSKDFAPTAHAPGITHSLVMGKIAEAVMKKQKLAEREPELLPLLLLISGHKLKRDSQLSDLFGYTIGPFFVSARFRQIVEQVEPSVHEFLPITIKSEAFGKTYDGYSLFMVYQQLPCVVIEKTGDKYKPASGDWGLAGVCTLRKDVIAGKHFWLGAKQVAAKGEIDYRASYFCSDELYRALKESKLTGFWGNPHVTIQIE